MNITTKKIIAKEALILIFCIVSTLIIWMSFNIFNYYQKYNFNKANKENIEYNLQLDSLYKPIELIDKKNELIRKKIFNQFCKIEGGVSNGEYVSPLPQKLIIYENIGELNSNSNNVFEEFGGHEIFFDRLCVMNFEKNQIKSLIDALGLPKFSINNFITQSEFYEKLINNNNYKNEVYSKLKKRYVDKNCNDIEEFNKIIGIGINDKFSLIMKEKNELKNKININAKNKSERQKKIISSEDVLKYTLSYLFIIFLILFILRYFYYSTKWAIKTLRFNEN